MSPTNDHHDERRVIAALELTSSRRAWFELPEDVRRAVETRAKGWRGWRIGGNVVGMGVARKTVRGSETDQLALKIYVVVKRPRRELPKESLVPARLRIPHLDGEIVTDVEEIGRMRLEALTTRVRPAVPGYSIGHYQSTAGTLGALVQGTDGADRGRLYILSNSHVLALSGTATRGDAILQPGPADDGGEKDRIASLARWQPFDFGPDFVNVADAALAGPLREGSVSVEIASIGVPAGVNTDLRRDMTVQKTGRTTGHTIGQVKDIHYRTALVYPKPGSGNGRVLYRDQVLCTRFTEPGDSGSLVLDEAKRAVGLHFSGSPAVSVFNPIAGVLASVAAELVGAVEPAVAEVQSAGRAEERLVRLALERNAPRLFAIPGVVGVGVGEKMSGGKGAGEKAVVVYVAEKKPRHQLRPDEIVPPLLEAPRGPGQAPVRVPTDVVEVGPMELE